MVWDTGGQPAQRRWRLFDMVKDRAEQNDLSASNPAKFEELQRAWDRYDKEVGVSN